MHRARPTRDCRLVRMPWTAQRVGKRDMRVRTCDEQVHACVCVRVRVECRRQPDRQAGTGRQTDSQPWKDSAGKARTHTLAHTYTPPSPLTSSRTPTVTDCRSLSNANSSFSLHSKLSYPALRYNPQCWLGRRYCSCSCSALAPSSLHLHAASSNPCTRCTTRTVHYCNYCVARTSLPPHSLRFSAALLRHSLRRARSLLSASDTAFDKVS